MIEVYALANFDFFHELWLREFVNVVNSCTKSNSIKLFLISVGINFIPMISFFLELVTSVFDMARYSFFSFPILLLFS